MNQWHYNKIKQLKDWKSDLNAVLVFAKTDEETRKDTVRYISLLDYAIEQIERVQELDDKLARIRFVNNDYDKQNKRYKQALEFYISYVVNQADVKWLINRVEELEEALMFYADEETYETKFATDTDEICDSFTLIELDEGKKARKALEGNSDE